MSAQPIWKHMESIQPAMNFETVVSKKLSAYPNARDAIINAAERDQRKRRAEDEFCGKVRRQLESLWQAHHDKVKILYVAYYPLPNIIRQSLSLRKTGRYTTALLGVCIREDIRVEQYFDAVYECENMLDLAELLATLNPDLIQAVTGPPMISCLAALFANAPVITEVYDSVIFYWNDYETGAEYQMERYSIEQSAGVLHKYPKQGHFQLINHYSIRVPVLQFHAYLITDFKVSRADNDPRRETPKLLITGGVIPPQRAIELGHGSYLLCDMINQVIGQGMQLTIYANQNAKDMRWHRQKQYFDLQKENPLFRFRAGIPIDRIGMAGRHYHFGFFYDNLKTHQYNPIHFQFATATKLFSYMEMGLPLLIYPEFEFTCSLVERYGIGLIYDTKALSKLKNKIQSCDYKQLTVNVEAFRKFANMENYLPILQEFHSSVLDGVTQRQTFNRFFPLERDSYA